MKYIPWKLEPPEEHREAYATARADGNAERLRATAAVLVILFTGLCAQYFLIPGLSEKNRLDWLYFAIYIAFILGSGGFLLFGKLASRGAPSRLSHWFLVALILGGTASLAALDFTITGDQSALLLGLISVAVIFRCRFAWFACCVAATAIAFVLETYAMQGNSLSSAISMPLAIDVIGAGILAIALGHYDLRAFSMRAELAKSIRERDALFQELQHRVKNSLSMVSSLLSLDEQRLGEGEPKEMLRRAGNRIRAMSAVYERLYRTGELDTVDLASYAAELVDMLVEANAIDPQRIRVVKRLQSLRVDLKQAIPLGLILNELVTNSIKHAFPGGRAGSISVCLERSGDRALMRVMDDGVGLPPASSPGSSDGLGMRLVGLLADQLKAELRTLKGTGAGLEISFPA